VISTKISITKVEITLVVLISLIIIVPQLTILGLAKVVPILFLLWFVIVMRNKTALINNSVFWGFFILGIYLFLHTLFFKGSYFEKEFTTGIHIIIIFIFSVYYSLKENKEKIFKMDKLWFRSIIEPMFDENRKITGAVHILNDITDVKNKETKLKEQKDFIQLAIDSLTHPFYIIDINTYEIILKNKASDKIFPSTDIHCYAKTQDLLKPCNVVDNKCPIVEIKKTHKPVIIEHTHTYENNVTKIMEIHSFPIFDRSGKVVQIIQYSNDITERKMAEEESIKQEENLRHADKMISLGILVSGVAHEINNPNNAIILNSSFLNKSFNDIVPILDNYYSKNSSLNIAGLKYKDFKDEIREIFSGITRSSDRIKTIVEELKMYSRKEKSIFKSEIDVNMVVKAALDLLKAMVKKSTKKLSNARIITPEYLANQIN